MEEINIFAASPDLAKCKHSKDDCSFRNRFQRDRDRILYSKEFKRLDRKTQVFVAGFDDHIRNRLTHTIEVAQISRRIACNLGLDVDLTAAIAYGHDVGHTPFGHVGERTLNYFTNGCANKSSDLSLIPKLRGFKHNWQSTRVLTQLEKISPDFDGLNLTNYTLWGILKHTALKSIKCEYQSKEGRCNYRHFTKDCKIKVEGLTLNFYNHGSSFFTSESSWTFEALAVKCADEIAQRHHDLEDGLYAGIIDKKEVKLMLDPLSKCFNPKELLIFSTLESIENIGIFIYTLSSLLIDFFVTNLVSQTKNTFERLKKDYEINSSYSFHKAKVKIAKSEDVLKLMSYPSPIEVCDKSLHDSLKNRILNSQITQSMDAKSTYIICQLIEAYQDNPQQLPDKTIDTLYGRYLSKTALQEYKDDPFQLRIGKLRERLKIDHRTKNTINYKDFLIRTICDYIAGMTDDFAIDQYNKLYGSENVFNNY